MSCRAVATLLSSRRRRVGGPSAACGKADGGRGEVPGMSTTGCVLREVEGSDEGVTLVTGSDDDTGASGEDGRTGGLGGVGCGGGKGRRGLLTRPQIMASKPAFATPTTHKGAQIVRRRLRRCVDQRRLRAPAGI